ncbi:MAG: glutathione S-transferase [Gammaproteobacteria bacterium]|jgi:glutathione S-transferase
MIELWGRRNAYNVQKVIWTVEELSIEYQHREVGSNEGDLDQAHFVELNPHRRIPVLIDNDQILWESNSISRYLARQYGDRLLPGDAFDQSRVERWMDWELTKLQPAFIALFWGYYRKTESERDQKVINQAMAVCQHTFNLLNNELSNSAYLVGDHFSLADITCGTCLYRYFNMGLTVEQPPAVMDWYHRLLTRPVMQKHIAVAFDELAGRSNY